MLIQRKTAGMPITPANPGCPGPPGECRPARHRPSRAGVIAAVLAAGCLAGCAGGPATARHATAARRTGLTAPAVTQAGSLVRVPRPDYSSAASVAAAFYAAWGSTDAIHDGPDAYAARCAPLVTAVLGKQLTASQPAIAAWQDLHRDQMVSLVQVHAVTRPAGAPLPTPQAVYLRVYATRVTTSTAGRTVSSDGITLRLTRSGGRWLVSAVLFY